MKDQAHKTIGLQPDRDGRVLSIELLCPVVSVLFARSDSIYKTLDGCDVWDIERNALSWPGGNPVVAHPPCQRWGKFWAGQAVLGGGCDISPAREMVNASWLCGPSNKCAAGVVCSNIP